MNEAREHFLARAALAVQEHRDVALRDARREIQQLAARRVLGYGLRRRRRVACGDAAARVARNALLELFGFEWFDEIVDGAVTHRGDRLIDRAVSRHQQHGRRRLALLQTSE